MVNSSIRSTFSTSSPATARPSSKKSFGSKPSGIQNAMSLKHGGYFEYGLNVVSWPGLNCFENRVSSVQKSRICEEGHAR